MTAVRLHFVPESYTGPCPGHVTLVADITTDGPGTVWYRFLAGAVSSSPEGTVKFSAAGTKTVSLEGTFRFTPRVPHGSVIAAMQDAQGNHGPRTVTSGPVNYNITCAGQAPVAPAASRGLPERTTVEAEYAGGTPIQFKLPEQVAFLFVQTIKGLESNPCVHDLQRLCSMEELVRGVKGKDGRVVGFKRNPMQETDYRYLLTFFGEPYHTAERYQLEAVPRRPGLGGFLLVSDKRGFGDFYFNPNGAATTKDKKLGSYGSRGDDFTAR